MMTSTSLSFRTDSPVWRFQRTKLSKVKFWRSGAKESAVTSLIWRGGKRCPQLDTWRLDHGCPKRLRPPPSHMVPPPLGEGELHLPHLPFPHLPIPAGTEFIIPLSRQMRLVSLYTGTNSTHAGKSDAIYLDSGSSGNWIYELSDGLGEESEVPLDTWRPLVCEVEMCQNFAIWQWAQEEFFRKWFSLFLLASATRLA